MASIKIKEPGEFVLACSGIKYFFLQLSWFKMFPLINADAPLSLNRAAVLPLGRRVADGVGHVSAAKYLNVSSP